MSSGIASIRVPNATSIPRTSDEDQTNLLLRGVLEKRGMRRNARAADAPYWPASFFGLQKSTAFRGSPEAQQQKILSYCTQVLMEESFFIEKLGMAYANKMGLLAETMEERALYCHIASDEAAHLMMVAQMYRGETPTSTSHPFVHLLENALQSDDKSALIFLTQVVLEGWGLAHYRSLYASTTNDDLRWVLGQILQDEARHHGGGLIAARSSTYSKRTTETLVETLRAFLQMIQAGPQAVVNAMTAVLGLDSAQKRKAFEELDAEKTTHLKLQQLYRLVGLAPNNDLQEKLGALRAFVPLSAEQCAAI